MRDICQTYITHITYAAFHTIDHVILFDILVKYEGLWGKALDLIKSYVLDRTAACAN